MFLFFLLLWIIFNGRMTLEIFLFGVVLSAFINLFFCKFMGYDSASDMKIARNFPLGVLYALLLIVEVIKANIGVIKLVLSRRIEVEPVLVAFKPELRSNLARVALANSITLTPGTITCDLTEDGEFVVHCLDEGMAQGMADSSFVRLLQKMEGTR